MVNRARRTVIWIVIIACALVVAAAGYYYGRVVPLVRAGKRQGIFTTESTRPSVAGFGFETAGGARHSIGDFKGKVVVLDVWATWCSTCIYSIPNIVALEKKYSGWPVEIIGMDVDRGGWSKVKPFLQKHPEMNYGIAVPYPAPPFLIQSLVDLRPLGEVSAIPTVFVVDRQGRLAGKFIELGHEQEIDDLVGRLLAE